MLASSIGSVSVPQFQGPPVAKPGPTARHGVKPEPMGYPVAKPGPTARHGVEPEPMGYPVAEPGPTAQTKGSLNAMA
jgi:hypothetical protein